MPAGRVLIVGTGARKHALVRRLLDDGCEDVWVVPANPALARLPVREAPVGTGSLRLLAGWARGEAIDLAIVLDEGLLFQGIADEFQKAGVACLGARRSAALIERSKIFAKTLMQRAGVETPQWQTYSSARAGWDNCPHLTFPAVIKADGPTTGQGVFVVDDVAEARRALRWLGEQQDGSAPVLVESYLEGAELSLTVLVDDGGELMLLPLVHEYKRAAAGDRENITTGMGAFAPVRMDGGTIDAVLDSIRRVLRELLQEGLNYTGSLTTNVILSPSGPSLLEFNSHMGDPETQTVLPLVGGSLLDIFHTVATGCLGGFVDLNRSASGSSVSLTMVRTGYSDPSRSNIVLPEHLTEDENLLFYEMYPVDCGLSPRGRRVLCCQASADTFDEAMACSRGMAIRVAKLVPGLTFRHDIGIDGDAMAP